MSRLQDKMYNHEVNPPAKTWDKIAAALDESALQDKFPARLYNMEVTPPAGAWEKIGETLEPQPGRVAPVKILNPFFRYIAAAILVGAVAWGVIQFAISKDGDGEHSATAIATTDSNKKDIKPVDTGSGLANNNNNVAPKETPAKRNIDRAETVTRKTNRKINQPLAMPLEEDDNDLSQSIYAYADHVPDIADRYIMLMTPDGKLIRMSKKWSDLLCCVSGEEQDPGCKNQIKKWQEKIASSSLAPSPGNFMDILGLVNSLEDDNGL